MAGCGLADLAAADCPAAWAAVSWALGGFTAEFGMGSGGAPPAMATRSAKPGTGCWWCDVRAWGSAGIGTVLRRLRCRCARCRRVCVRVAGVRGRACGLGLVMVPCRALIGLTLIGAGRGGGRACRAIRTAWLRALLRLHLRPIDVVVYHGPWRDLV